MMCVCVCVCVCVQFRAGFKQSKGSASKFASLVADASRLRFNDQGLPRQWRGPPWLAEQPGAGRQQQQPPQQQQQQQQQQHSGHTPSSAAALHDGLPGHSRQAGGGLFSVDTDKQRAVRDWALRRLEFDRSLEEREGGLVVGELRSAFAAETGVRVGHKDQWCV